MPRLWVRAFSQNRVWRYIRPADRCVLERFYRVKRTEVSPQGSGLGLAIAKGFVEAFHGSIELISPVIGGKGTTVAIRLPIVQEAA